jgi:hypothetical protein
MNFGWGFREEGDGEGRGNIGYSSLLQGKLIAEKVQSDASPEADE